MPVETTVTRCGNCGAVVQRVPGATSVTCTWCAQVTWLTPTAHPTCAAPEARVQRPRETATAAPDDILERVEAGVLEEHVGRARRLRPSEAPLYDPALAERALWPTGADASSTYGGPWSPSTMLGPPRVYPRCGDLIGAWAPAPPTSAVEWVEVRFASEIAVSALRVYETHRAGSTYAIVDMTRGERLLYAGPVETRDGAAVLEVQLDAPRVIKTLRVYVVNRGWTELDAVALLAASPLPMELRAPIPRPGRGALLVAAVVLALACAGAAVGVLNVGGTRAPSPRAPSLRAPRRPLPSVVSTVPGAAFTYTRVAPELLAAGKVRWATAVSDFSTEYSTTRNAAADVVGPPDVYPRNGDIDGAWASLETDAGDEWITVRFAAPTRATAVVWAETLSPGAVVRVDDVSDPAAPVALWSGVASPSSAAADVAQVTLASPRTLSAVRIVLDTRRVTGWNEIDAIGLIPAAP